MQRFIGALIVGLLALGTAHGQDADKRAARERMRAEKQANRQQSGETHKRERGPEGKNRERAQQPAWRIDVRSLDTNHDMIVDQTELAAGVPQMKSRIREAESAVLAAFDKDGSGALDEQEAAEMDRMAQAIDAARTVRQYDTNHDQILTDEELAAAEGQLKQMAERTNEAVLKRFDTNGNGVIDDDERQAKRGERPNQEKRERPQRDKAK